MRDIWGFPKKGGTLLRVPRIRIIVFWGLDWDPPYFGKLPYRGYIGIMETTIMGC